MMEFDLKQVFSIFDQNGEGQIQLRHFVDVANNYYSDAEQLAHITKALDPENTGFINFNQFCEGITQISSLQGLTLNEVASDLTRRSRENSLVEDSDRRSLKTAHTFDFSSLSTWRNVIQEENQDGSTTTFGEYDVDTDDTFHQPKQNSSVVFRTPNNKETISQKTHLNSNRNNQSLTFNLDSTVYGDEVEFAGVAEPDSTSYSRPVSQRFSHISKRNSYLQSLLPVESGDHPLQETVSELQKTVDTLHDEKQTTTKRLSRIQTENIDLKSRLLALEDRLHDLEGQHQCTAQSEKQKYVEFINQKDRTFLEEKEILTSSVMRINAIETELKQTQTSNTQMKRDVTNLQQRLEDVDIQLNVSQTRCTHLAEDNEKLLEQIRLQRDELEVEKLNNAQLVEQLKNESTRLKFGRSLTQTESILKTSEVRIQDLDGEIQALRAENARLKRENDELSERDLAMGVQRGRMLVSDRDTLSYAAELEVLSKDELMNKLRDQYSINDRLRDYIERMLSVIIEHNPQLLEVTTSTGISISSMAMSVPVGSCSTSDKTITNVTNKQAPDKYCRLS